MRVYDAQGKRVIAQLVAGQAAEVALVGNPSGIYMGNLQLLKKIFAMRIHGNDFQKHELSLIDMNLWSLHGNSCLIFNNDYHECAPFRGNF